MYLLAPLILQSLKKKVFGADPELRWYVISGTKMANFSWKFFFGTNHYHYFHLPTGPFHCAKLKKKILQQIHSYVNAPFLGPKWSTCPKQFFFENYHYHSHLPISPFHFGKILKFFQQIQHYEDVQFLGPKWPISPNDIFFQKTC